MSRYERLLPLLLVLAVLTLAFPALDDYNVTWDEALGDFFFGERYLSYFLTLDPAYLDFEAEPYPPGHVPNLSLSPFRNRPWEYYPAANVLAALVSRVLSGGLGLVDSFDGFHAVNLVFTALFLPLLFSFARRSFGRVAALAACGFLFLAPRVVCHMLANIKDYPQMALFGATLFAAFAAYERRSWRALGAAGLVWGLALATKANALFLPGILGLLVVLDFWRGRPFAWRGREARLVGGLLLFGLLGPLVMLALWPYLWPDPVGRFLHHLDYISGQIFQVRAESVLDPSLAILGTTPPLFLVLAVAGLGLLVRRAAGGDRAAMLVVAWTAVVTGRLYLPQAVNFDGVRHFLELFPALALAAGAAVEELARRLSALRLFVGKPALSAGVLLLLLLLPSAVAVVRTHPHQIAYWNLFVGGLPGARALGIPQSGDYWGMSYRQGLRWLNERAPEGAVLAVPIVEHAVLLVAPERLRQDLGLASVTVPFRPDIEPRRLAMLQALAAERTVFVMFVLRDDWENELMRDCRERLEPAAEWLLDGEPLLQIYAYRPPAGETEPAPEGSG